MTKIAILGGGQIGEALTSGLVESGFNASDITVTNRTASRGEELKSNYGVNVTTDNAEAVDGADYIFASVKPYAILDLLGEINPAKDAVVVSMAAGLTLEALQAAAGDGVPVVRVMPNTPMLVRRGMCTCAAGEHVTEAQMQGVTELLEAVGEVAVIPEKNIDAATAGSMLCGTATRRLRGTHTFSAYEPGALCQATSVPSAISPAGSAMTRPHPSVPGM